MCHSYSGSAMNVVFTEDEMKKFLAEATRVSQVLVFALPLLLLFVFAVFVPPVLCFPSVSVLLFPNSLPCLGRSQGNSSLTPLFIPQRVDLECKNLCKLLLWHLALQITY